MKPVSRRDNGETIRAFIAIDLPGEIISGISGILSRLEKTGKGVRWAKAESIHLTLKFLGDIKEDDAKRLGEALEDLPGGPVGLSLGSAGGFPDMRRPRVVWLGLEGETDRLAGLWQEVEERCSVLGFPKEKRGFLPHLTLGRIKVRKGERLEGLPGLLREVLGNVNTDGIQPFTAYAVHLYRSILGADGAEYRKIKSFTLKS